MFQLSNLFRKTRRKRLIKKLNECPITHLYGLAFATDAALICHDGKIVDIIPE